MKKIITMIITVALLTSLMSIAVSAVEFVRIWSDNEHESYLAEYAGDGDTEKFWHTDWENGITDPPYIIFFELDGIYNINSLGFLPRQDGNLNGLMNVFNIYVSEDGENYNLVKEVDDFITDMDIQTVTFDSPVTAKFIKLEALETEGMNFASLNELEVDGEIAPEPEPEVVEPESTTDDTPETPDQTIPEEPSVTPTAPQTSDMSVGVFITMMAVSMMIMILLINKKMVCKINKQ